MVRLILAVIFGLIGWGIGLCCEHPYLGAFVGALFGLIGPDALDIVDPD